MERQRTIGLVLGGGGARGFAHIGVLRALEERGWTVAAVAGCSMGGIVGALYAAGNAPGAIRDIFAGLSYARLVDPPRRGALLGGRGFARALARWLPERFEGLRIPLAVTAVDVQDGEIVVLREGALVEALRATAAVPGVFEPVEIDGRILIDGGILNSVPVMVGRSLTQRPVLAVDVTPPRDRRIPFDDARSFWEKLRAPLTGERRPLIVDLFIKAFDIPAAALTEATLAIQSPEVLVRPPLDRGLKIEDVRRLDEAVEAGYRSACEALDAHADALLREGE